MSLIFLDKYKPIIITLMPIVAIVMVLGCYFLPLAIGTRVLLGFIFGLVGRAVLPYYMKWKESNEELKFNYTYIVPILVLIATAVIGGLVGFDVYVTALFVNDPPYIIYFGAVLFAYGGNDLFNGLRKWQGFLGDVWKTAQEIPSASPTPPIPPTPIVAPAEEKPVTGTPPS